MLNVPLIVVLATKLRRGEATLSALDDGVVPGGYVRDIVERSDPVHSVGRATV